MEQQEHQSKIETLRRELQSLTDRIAALETEPANAVGEWPQEGDHHYYVVAGGMIFSDVWKGDEEDQAAWRMGNVFHTEQEAEQHKLRLESMANRWRPNNKQPYFYWNLLHDRVDNNIYLARLSADYYKGLIGNCHRTEKAAAAWGAKYGESWKALLEVQS